MNIYCLHNGTGSRYYRLIPQLKKMQERGHKVIMDRHDDQHIREKIEWADLVIFQMVFSEEWVKFAKAQGKQVIFECDDLIHSVPKEHYSYKEVKGIKGFLFYLKIWKVLRHCDGFISTTKGLDKVYGWMAKRSLVFENYADLPHWLKEPRANPTKRVRLLWAGSTSHTPDLLAFKPILARIMAKYPQVQFVYIGHGGIKSTDLQAKFIYGDDLFEGLSDNRESLLPVPANVWPYVLSGLEADIAVAPLEKNYFNKFKSQCKFMEYSISRIPGVYSAWHYTDVEHGVTGFRAETPEEWEMYLSELIENDILRKNIGEAAYRNVLEKHDIRDYIGNWARFVESFTDESIKSKAEI